MNRAGAVKSRWSRRKRLGFLVYFLSFALCAIFLLTRLNNAAQLEKRRFALVKAVYYEADSTTTERLLQEGADANTKFSEQEAVQLARRLTAMAPLEDSLTPPYSWWYYCQDFMSGKRTSRFLGPQQERTNSLFCLTVLRVALEPEVFDRALVVVFLGHGADPNVFNLSATGLPETPLTCAASEGGADVVRLLLQYGADPTLPDKGGRTPLQAALTGKDKATIGIIRRALAAKATTGAKMPLPTPQPKTTPSGL